jgi:hypothetical protein
MRKLFFSLLVLIAAMSACKKESSTSTANEQAINTSSLPLKVTDYVSNNYPAETITSALKLTSSNATYLVTLNTREELAFDDNGGFLGNGEDFHHHHGDSLGEPPSDSLGHHGGHGHHGHGHGGHGGHGEPGNSISLDSLPATIGAYITANYAGYTAMHAEIDTLCQFGAVYEIMVEQSGADHLKLLFDISGNFLAKAERALYADAPQAVTDYISVNYANYITRDKIEKLTLEDSSLQFSIFLAHPGIKLNVILNSDGTLVCENEMIH